MRIDIHSHTKKTKSGDSEHRNITPEKFDEIIRLTDVRILAITNHNHFDLEQFNQISSKVQDVCQIWPAIELDILEGGRRGHLIVCVSPIKAKIFYDITEQLLIGKTPDNFTISIEETVTHYEALEPIYIAHYFAKKPNLSDEDVGKLLTFVSNKNRVLKEVTNSISAGIYISHGHNSIYGSDIQNWQDYQKISKELPELRLPVESFEQFCLLLEKDTATINTILNRKTKENIQISPFGVAELVNLDIYNDINIIFGSKGTGKTEILRALSKYYNDLGFKNTIYESSTKRLEDTYDLRGNYFDTEVEDFGIDECVDELKAIRNSSEKNITSISSYYRYYSAEETNRIAKSIKIRNFSKLDESSSERRFNEALTTLKKIRTLLELVENDKTFIEIIGDELLVEFTAVIKKILLKLREESQLRAINLKNLSLFNQIIEVLVVEIAKKTGQPQKPISTGFADYARNRIKIERDLKKVLSNISVLIEPEVKYVGDLGEKGKLYCQTNLFIQNGKLVNVNYSPVKKVNKNPQRNFAIKLSQISKYLYSNSLFEKITELNDTEGAETINSLSDLLLFYRHFTLNNDAYTPSSGESSMVMLHNELLEDKEIYIIDEPEKSLGNDYISDVIVPILKQRAQSSKKIIIATHDANIAVRTLPYNSIYRKHDINGYYTYTGNPFANNLICINDSKPSLNWKEISMKTLEGGKKAFGERSKIYGNT